MKKYLVFWMFITFILTVIVNAVVITNLEALSGTTSYLASAATFIVLGLVLYAPVKRKFD